MMSVSLGVLTVSAIKEHVARCYGVRVSDLDSPSRHRLVSRPRHVAMYLSRRLTGASLPRIGERFGGRDHTTVLYGVRAVEHLMQLDTSVRSEVEGLECALLARSSELV